MCCVDPLRSPRIVQIHHVVSGICEERGPAICPVRRDVFWNDLGGRAECGIIQRFLICVDDSGSQVWWQAFFAIDPTRLVRIRGDQAGIDTKL